MSCVYIGGSNSAEAALNEGLCKQNLIKIVIKYQTLDIEFLVIWLALYSRYKSYIL